MGADPRVIVAAKWWADWLRRHSVHRLERPVNTMGETEMRQLGGSNKIAEDNALRADVYADLLPSIAPEQADIFETALRKTLAEALIRDGRVTIGTDYHADPMFDDAFAAANMRPSGLRLPMKTCMWIREDIQVGLGYKGVPQRIWP